MNLIDKTLREHTLKLAILLQHIAPKQAMTALAGKLAHKEWGTLTTNFIAWFVKRYHVNMAEAANPDIASYPSFNNFFTRPLKVDARPLTNAKWICPVDGAISQFGEIKQDQIFQAKGHSYSITELLGSGDNALANRFNNGSFACLYLSPKDYHRIHMPCDGKLLSMTYVPGALFSVNPLTAQNVAGLFARNERVVCEFESDTHGRFIMVLVGATIVGSMATVWHDAKDRIINPPRTKNVRSWRYDSDNITLTKGEEMGRFLLGSTVVMVMEQGQCDFNQDWQPNQSIQLGEKMAD